MLREKGIAFDDEHLEIVNQDRDFQPRALKFFFHCISIYFTLCLILKGPVKIKWPLDFNEGRNIFRKHEKNK